MGWSGTVELRISGQFSIEILIDFRLKNLDFRLKNLDSCTSLSDQHRPMISVSYSPRLEDNPRPGGFTAPESTAEWWTKVRFHTQRDDFTLKIMNLY